MTGEVSVRPGQAGQGLGDTSQSLLATHSFILYSTQSPVFLTFSSPVVIFSLFLKKSSDLAKNRVTATLVKFLIEKFDI